MPEDAGEGCDMEAPDPWYVPWHCVWCGQRNDDDGPRCMFCNKERTETIGG